MYVSFTDPLQCRRFPARQKLFTAKGTLFHGRLHSFIAVAEVEFFEKDNS